MSTASRTAPLVVGAHVIARLEGVVDGLGEVGVRHGKRSCGIGRGLSGPGRGDVKAARGNAPEEAGQIVGHVIDMRRVVAFHLPGLAHHLARAFRHHQHGGHAERVRHFEIAREVLEHRSARRIDAVRFQEAVVGLRQRLRLEVGLVDAEHVLEMHVDVEPPHHGVGVRARAVGEDQLAAGKLLDRGAERWVRLERRVVDLVHEGEIRVRVHPVLGHHAAHRGAVTLVVVLLHPEGVVLADLQEVRDVGADALVHLLPQVQVMRIERVVEVEHPGFDMGEIARRAAGRGGGRHGGRVLAARAAPVIPETAPSRPASPPCRSPRNRSRSAPARRSSSARKSRSARRGCKAASGRPKPAACRRA